ncbi:hypothetical protein F5Y17DRAFT_456318 [Xylariaceae sp. FL0594]|nr:hypothetical protein F5Y17DRAFT_456318 [Xylariaceae sp. FL0594]
MTKSAGAGGQRASDEVSILRSRLFQLRAYLAVLEYDLQQSGIDLKGKCRSQYATRRETREERRAKQAPASPTTSDEMREAENTKRRQSAELRTRVRKAELELLLAAAQQKAASDAAHKGTPTKTRTRASTAKTKAGVVRDLLKPFLGHAPTVTSDDESSDAASDKNTKSQQPEAGQRQPDGFAMAAFAPDPESNSGEDTDTDIEGIGETMDELEGLNLDDVDDEVLATLHDTIALPLVKGQDWADTLFADIVSGGPTTVAPRPTATAFQANPTKPREKLVRKALNHFRLSDAKSRQRQPNRPPAADPTLYNPRYWSSGAEGKGGATEAVEGVPGKAETDTEVETGFVTWEVQEKRFPRLDQRLALQDISPPNIMQYDPATVDTQVWDPINRVETEARTGKRTPLKLNPVTTLSLELWTPSELGGLPSRKALQLPDKPSTEDKKGLLPSRALPRHRTGKPKTVRRTPAPVASPSAGNLESRSWIRPAPPGPPTPYPRLPEMPNVQRYLYLPVIDEDEGGLVERARKRPAVAADADTDTDTAARKKRARTKTTTTTYVQPSVADASDSSPSQEVSGRGGLDLEFDFNYPDEDAEVEVGTEEEEAAADAERIRRLRVLIGRDADDDRPLSSPSSATYGYGGTLEYTSQADNATPTPTTPTAPRAPLLLSTTSYADNAATTPTPTPTPTTTTPRALFSSHLIEGKEKGKGKEKVLDPASIGSVALAQAQDSSARKERKKHPEKSVRFDVADDDTSVPAAASSSRTTNLGENKGTGISRATHRAIGKFARTKNRVGDL